MRRLACVAFYLGAHSPASHTRRQWAESQNPAAVTDEQVYALRAAGLTDRGIVQLTHVVSDFGSYNTLNLALQTDYDYRDFWRELAFNN